MTGETRMLVGFVAALILVIGLASVAMQREPAAVDTVATEDLPICSGCDLDTEEPSPEACAEAGGTTRFRRSNECFSEPDVHDVCGFGVPCFENGNGFYCRDVKDPYCSCESDDQCPDGFECSGDQCLRIPVESDETVKTLRTYPL